MLKITQQQMTAFARSSISGFEERMVRHLGERFPLRCAAMEPSSLLRMVQSGIERAASHGITVEKDVSRFIGVMCALGEKFDVDPKLPWAADILGKAGPRRPAEKMDRLSKTASAHLSETQEGTPEDAVQAEAATALAQPPPAAATGEEFSSRTEVGQPVMPCAKPLKKRMLLFSA